MHRARDRDLGQLAVNWTKADGIQHGHGNTEDTLYSTTLGDRVAFLRTGRISELAFVR